MTAPRSTPPGAPGWYADPGGRFAQRYFDGGRWTEHVADGRGWSGPESAVPGGGPAPGNLHGGPPAGATRPNPVVLAAVGLGGLLMVLGLFALSWATVEEPVSLSDLRKVIGGAEDLGIGPPGIVSPYLGFGVYLAVFGLTIVTVASALVQGAARTALAIVAAAGAGIAVVAHFVAADDLVSGELSELGPGFWTIAAGMITMLAAGAFLAAQALTSRRSR